MTNGLGMAAIVLSCLCAVPSPLAAQTVAPATSAVDADPAVRVAPAVQFDVDAPAAESFAEYHFFLDAATQTPNRGVIPYRLNTPHFADYAQLHRFFWLPAGASVLCRDGAALEFPVGAVLILSVGYLADLRDLKSPERLIETRLFVNRRAGWEGLQYVWDDAGCDARLSVVGTRAEVSWLHFDGSQRRHTYLAPNRNECKECHQIDGVIQPLGPVEVRRVNRDCAYEDGSENQLTHWTRLGYLQGVVGDPDKLAKMPVWNDLSTGSLEQRARAYLAMNCSACHRPGGLAATSGLDLTFDQRIPFRYGVYKAPVAAGRGVGQGRFGIEPGAPDRSFLLHRLRSTDPGVRMPIVGRGATHDEGVALIRQWIASMSFPERTRAQAELDRRNRLDRPVSP